MIKCETLECLNKYECLTLHTIFGCLKKIRSMDLYLFHANYNIKLLALKNWKKKFNKNLH